MSFQKNGNSEAPAAKEVRAFYEARSTIYSPRDRWLTIVHKWIGRFIQKHSSLELGELDDWCLNLGSGGESYGVPEERLVHIDLDTQRFDAEQNAIQADLHKIPVASDTFRLCLCVGSVLNHCDAAVVIQQIANALVPGGALILEFESSRSLELLGSPHFARAASVIDTFYDDTRVRLWAYSEEYIVSLLSMNGLHVEHRDSCHHFSPLAYGILRNSNLAAYLQYLDPVGRMLPGFRACASNIIFACRKRRQ